MELYQLPDKLSHLTAMIETAKQRKTKNEKQLIRLYKDWNRTRIRLEAEKHLLTKIGDWRETKQSFFDLVKSGEINWEDEPMIVKEYRWLNQN